MLASGVELSKVNMSNLNSASLVCIATVELVIACSNQRACLEKYMLLFCRSPNKDLYSADCFSQCAISFLKRKR